MKEFKSNFIMKESLKHWVIVWLTASIVFILCGFAYAAWNDVVSTGDPVTATGWNEVVTKIGEIDADVWNLSFDNGNVWIWTTTPATELDVNGKISANSFGLTFERVTNTVTNTWPKQVNVLCNPGYTVVSWWCNAPAWWWRIVQSFPMTNWWHCATTDTYAVAYPTTVYAICVKTD